MKKIIFPAILLCISICSTASATTADTSFVKESSAAIGQSETAADGDTAAELEQTTDTVAVIDTGATLGATPGATPGASAGSLTQIKKHSGDFQDEFESEKVKFDLILDVSRGISLSRFTVTDPSYIATQGKTDFLFNVGIIVPFRKIFFGALDFRYVVLNYTLSEEQRFESIREKTSSDETLNFVSFPVKLGIRLTWKRWTPFVYVDGEPAYLTSASQLSVRDIRTVFPDGSVLVISNDSRDKQVTNYRQRFQFFVGGGIGTEFFYGYGAVYVEAGIQYALRDTDRPPDPASLPIRTSTSLFYVPLSLGIRFYL